MITANDIFSLKKRIRFPDKQGLGLILEEIKKVVDYYAANGLSKHIRQVIPAPAVASATAVHAAITLTASAQPAVTTGITNPDVPRALTITGAKAGATLTGSVVISGTNINDEAITDTIALNGDNTVIGSKAFKTVTNIALPVKVTTGDTVAIGFSDKLGLSNCLAADTVYMTLLDTAFETTRPTVTFDDNEVEKNLIDINGTLNDAKDVTVYYFKA